jgi:uncharacterized membrane protein
VIRLARTFAWLRWRLLVNAFRGTKRRDPLERVSRAASVIVPIVLVALFVPALVGMGVLGLAAGWFLGKGGDGSQLVTIFLRIWLVGITWIVIIAPAIRAARRPSSDLGRLLLLPIPRRLLHLSELASGLADPWIAIVVPGLLLLPIGLAASGALAVAAVAAIASLAMIGSLLALESCVSSLLGLLYRNRRRGEIVTLVVLLVITATSLIPMVVDSQIDRKRGHERGRRSHAASAEAQGSAEARPEGSSDSGPASGRTDGGVPAGRTDGGLTAGRKGAGLATGPTDGGQASQASGPNAAGSGKTDRGRSREGPLSIVPVVPSELYAGTLLGALQGRSRAAAGLLGGLLLFGAALYSLSWWAYRRLLDSPETGSRRRTGAIVDAPARRIPGLSAAACSVAFATVRTIRRTVQGKMAIYFSPISLLIVFVMFSRLKGRAEGVSVLTHTGPAMAYFGFTILFLGYQKMLLNQFALDGAGLTLQLLLPLSERDLVVGKASGIALLVSAPGLLCIVAAAVLAPDPSPWLWIAAALGAVSGFILFVPIGAALSALFPKPVDLGRFGSAGQVNQLAGLIGFAVTPLTFGPPVLLALTAIFLFRQPALAPVLCGIWLILAALLARLLLGFAAGLIAGRRENLALVAQGR